MSDAVVTRLMRGKIVLTANPCISVVKLDVASSTKTTSYPCSHACRAVDESSRAGVELNHKRFF
jgi:hypothetical protein